MSLDSYGGSSDLIATRDEILRIASEIKRATEELSLELTLLKAMEDPIRYLSFLSATQSVTSRLSDLHNRAQLAAEGYFSTEAQIHRRFEIGFIPELAELVIRGGTLLGWKLESQVKAELTKQTFLAKPKDITSILDRLNALSYLAEPTVGIDIFEGENGRTALVYIPGTQSFGLGSGSNPLDMASNIQAISAEGEAASERAVILAMTQAGIKEQDRVIFVGHSQGGMVAGNLAANSGSYLAVGLIGFGAPLAQLAIRKIPVMAIEHSNDPVPNLSGKVNPLRSNWVTIQRSSAKSESDAFLYSHSLKSYRNTTQEIDKAVSRGIRDIRMELFRELRDKSSGSSMNFRISRITKS